MNDQKKVVLVTGGSGDIGQAVVQRMVQAGMRVAFTYHSNQAAVEQLLRVCGPEQVQALRVSENNLAEARRVVESVKETWGRLDYLVNCVGRLRDKTFVRMEEEDWRESMQINLDVPFAFARAVIFDFLKLQKGAIVNIVSVAALTGAVGQANYAAAKAGVLGLTKSLAREGGRFGVRINAIAPGYIASRMIEQLPEKIKTHALEMIPMARFGEPQDVAHAVAFLLSDEARYITGQVLVVDGGMVM